MNDGGETARVSPVSETLAATKPGRRIGWAVVGGVLLLGLAWFALQGVSRGTARSSAKGGAPAAVPVTVAVTERRDVPVYLTGLGTITAFNTVTVHSRVDGQIVQVAFKEGQDVNKGDLLVVIDPRPFEVQLAQAQASLARDQAQLADAQLNLTRDKDLFDQGILPQQQLDSQRSLVQQNQASAQVDQAQIDNARLQLTYCRITAPVGGRVGLRLVDEGNVVRAADQNGMLVITQLEPITVVFTLPEDNLLTVARKMKAGTLAADAYSRDDQTKLASGTLLTIDNQIDPTTGTGRLKAVFENRDHALWPNQFVNVRLLIETRKDQTVVPAAAVQRSSQGAFAYVVKPDKTVEMRLLKVGLSQAAIATIDTGVAPGELVITDGHEKVQAGTRVEASQAAKPTPAS